VLMIPLAVEAAQYHLSAITIAANKLSVPALALIGFGVGNIGLAILLTVHFHWGLYGVAAAGAVTSLARNGVFMQLYTASVVEQPWAAALRHTGNALAACLLLAGTAALVSLLVRPGSWLRLGLAAAPVSIAYIGVIYFFALNDEERLTLRKIALSSLKLQS
jgi:hypothetical protein